MSELVVYRKKNRKAQAIAAGTSAVAVVALTSATLISLPVAAVVAGVWWLTGKITEK